MAELWKELHLRALSFASGNDMSYLMDFAKKPYNKRWTEKTALKRIKDYFKHMTLLVTEIDREIVGFVIYQISMGDEGKRGKIIEIAVSSEYRGRGIGNKLMQEVESILRRNGARHIGLQTHKKSGAFKFYKKRGYKESGFVEFRKKLR
jgi:ribosomal protein S18 acetylase RimI-like enzyme